MKLYIVRYDGVCFGGEAFVFAENENEAIEKVRNDYRTSRFENGKAEEIEPKGVIHNDDGDYW